MKGQMKPLVDMLEEEHRFVFIDVGALGGLPPKWLPLKNYINIIGFEPDKREFDILVKKNNASTKYFNYALSDKSTDLVYYIIKGHGLSSIYKPNMDVLSYYEDSERFNIIKEEVLTSSKVRGLDFLFEENFVNDSDFIKLDTQGSELLILKGGERKVIPKIFGVQVEVEFIEMYKGQPLFRDIDEFLDAKGFALIDLRRLYWKRKNYYQYRGKGQLIFGDALYFKKIDVFCNEISALKGTGQRRAKILKSIITCLVYKMFDYAVAIARAGVEHNYLDTNEYIRVFSIIKKYSQKGIPLWINLGRLYYPIINRILQPFKPPSHLGWSDGDLEISNVRDF